MMRMGKIKYTTSSHQRCLIWLSRMTLRENLDPHFFEKIKPKIKILYGGSIDDTNCLELSKSNLIDGFLIGSSSLKPQVFKEIIKLL